MKKSLLLLAMMALYVQSPAQKTQHPKKSEAAKDTVASYHCPMKCQKDKHYTKEGKCETCGMKLVKDKNLKSK